MNTSQRLLLASDSEAVGQAITREFTQGGLSTSVTRVAESGALHAALRESWDVAFVEAGVLAPEWAAAVNFFHVNSQPPPLVALVDDGAEGEGAIAAGAQDYALKSDSSQWRPASERAQRSRLRRPSPERPEPSWITGSGFYPVLADIATDAVLCVEQDQVLSYVNPAIERILGYQPRELIGQLITLIIPGRLRPVHTAAFDRYLHTGDRRITWEGTEFPALHKDGTEIPIEISFGERAWEGRQRFIGIMRDIRERKRVESELRRAATVFDSTSEGIAVVEPDGRIAVTNRAFQQITGFSAVDIQGQPIERLYVSFDHIESFADVWAAAGRDGVWRGEIWSRRRSGELFPQWLSIGAVRAQDGSIAQYVCVFSDLTAIKQSQEQLDFLAHHDPITALPNRMLFGARLDHAIQRSESSNAKVAVLLLDLDRFKNVVDTLGHDASDGLLQAVAGRLSGYIKGTDTLARVGGDEFAVLMDDVRDLQASGVLAQKLIGCFEQPFLVSGQEVYTTASIGISLFPQDGRSAADLLRNADTALHRAKERGRNGYQFYTAELTRLARARFQMEHGLRRALERGELDLFFQPQFDIRAGRLTAAEALIRWHHPVLGLVGPKWFYTVARESGLLAPISTFALQQACAQARRWRDAGYAMRIAVNVSEQQLLQGDLSQTVERSLAQAGLEAASLELEITEDFLMQAADEASGTLQRLRDLGVSLAIDDFGTGYSSLSYLKRLPINRLKIDQSFVRGVPDNSDDAAIARAIIALGHSLHLSVIAEGVETEAQNMFLRTEGCDELQGFFYGEPISADRFFSLLETSSAAPI